MKYKSIGIIGLSIMLLTACNSTKSDKTSPSIDTNAVEIEQVDLSGGSTPAGDNYNTGVQDYGTNLNEETPHESFIGVPYIIETKMANYTLTAVSVDVVHARGNVHQYITDQDFQLKEDEALILVTISLSTDTPNVSQNIIPEQFTIVINNTRYLGTSSLETNFAQSCILTSDATQQITVPFLVPNDVDETQSLEFICNGTSIFL